MNVWRAPEAMLWWSRSWPLTSQKHQVQQETHLEPPVLSVAKTVIRLSFSLRTLVVFLAALINALMARESCIVITWLCCAQSKGNWSSHPCATAHKADHRHLAGPIPAKQLPIADSSEAEQCDWSKLIKRGSAAAVRHANYSLSDACGFI